MEKYLVKIEFRYSDAPETEDGSTSKNNVLTTGGFNPPRWYEAQKNKKKGGKI